MKTSGNYSVSINEPCHENWDKMTPTEQGRFCGSCKKEVQDFSHMDQNQYQVKIQSLVDVDFCGRFRNEQLAFIGESKPSVSRKWGIFTSVILLLVSGRVWAQKKIKETFNLERLPERECHRYQGAPIIAFKKDSVHKDTLIHTAGLPVITYDLLPIYFDYDDYELTTEARNELKKYISAIRKEEIDSITISGFTDIKGASDYNKVLSRNRAKAVCDYLRRHDVKSTIVIVAEGSDKPVGDNKTDSGRLLNRRVTIKMIQNKKVICKPDSGGK